MTVHKCNMHAYCDTMCSDNILHLVKSKEFKES